MVQWDVSVAGLTGMEGWVDLPEHWGLKIKGASDNNRLMLTSSPGAVGNCCSVMCCG